jgi:hypothetical protein
VHHTAQPPATPTPEPTPTATATCGACVGRVSRRARPTLGPCALPPHDDTVHQDADGRLWSELQRFTPISRTAPRRATQPPDTDGDGGKDRQIAALQAEITQLRAQLGQPQETA